MCSMIGTRLSPAVKRPDPVATGFYWVLFSGMGHDWSFIGTTEGRAMDEIGHQKPHRRSCDAVLRGDMSAILADFSDELRP